MADLKVECVLAASAELGECPLWSVKDQQLYWVDITGKSFNAFDPASGKNRRWSLPKAPGSFVLTDDGGVVLALSDGLYRFDPEVGLGERLVAAPFDVERLRFNDGRTDRTGRRFWLGSMLDDLSEERDEGSYYSFDGRDLVERITSIYHANGTAFSLDNRTMFRSETTHRKIFAYDHDPDTGELSNQRIFATVPDSLGMPDGCAIDAEGGYWSALPGGPNGGSLARFTPDGHLDLVIDLPVAVGTMPAFGGPDLTTIYMTSGRLEEFLGFPPNELAGSIFAIETPYHGLPEVPLRMAEAGRR